MTATEHGLDDITCPECGGPTRRRMVTDYGKCTRWVKIARKALYGGAR